MKSCKSCQAKRSARAYASGPGSEVVRAMVLNHSGHSF